MSSHPVEDTAMEDDEEMDPELAMALQMSMADEGAAQPGPDADVSPCLTDRLHRAIALY